MQQKQTVNKGNKFINRNKVRNMHKMQVIKLGVAMSELRYMER